MSLLDVKPSDVQDTKPAEAGTYRLRLEKAETQTSKAGSPMLYAEYRILDKRAWPIRDYRLIPTESDDPDQIEMRLSSLKFFFLAFAGDLANGRTFSEMLKPEFLERLIGNEVDAIVKVEEPKEGSDYQASNKVKRFL